MINEEHLQEWERLANEATEGPWLMFEEAKEEYKDYRHSFDWWQIIALNKAIKMPFVLCSSNGCLTTKEEKEKAFRTGKEPEGQTKKDLAFIAAAREAVPALIAEVRRTVALWRFTCAELREKTEQLEKEADWLADKVFRLSNLCADPQKKKSGDCKGECAKCWREVARKVVAE